MAYLKTHGVSDGANEAYKICIRQYNFMVLEVILHFCVMYCIYKHKSVYHLTC